MLIEFDTISKVYEIGSVKVNALHDVSLKIEENEYLSIMGPSGSGKSTMMNILGCLDSPTSGNYYFAGQQVSLMNDDQLAEIRNREIGFVFQTFNLIPTLTALENVTLPMAFQGVPEEIRIKKAKKLLALVGLWERIRHRPTELSGGERQRVAIARALANDPELILADEPTGNLDSKSGQEILSLLKNLHKKENKTIVVVTHDINIARKTERIAHLRDGKIVS